MRSLNRTLTSSLLGIILVASTLVVASTPAGAAATRSTTSAIRTNQGASPTALASAWAAEAAAKASPAGKPCRMKCKIVNRYAYWLAILLFTGAPIPGARWNDRQKLFLRHHPRFARHLGPTDIFRHPGKRSFTKKVRTRRDRRHRGIPAEAFTKGGGLNYCTTLTFRRKFESDIFKFDLVTIAHKVRWCWDKKVIYDHGEGNWTEVEVHDPVSVINNGEVDHHNGDLPTRGTWYTSQQYSVCNCLVRYGTIGYWQPIWRVWAKPGGEFTWDAHW